MEKEMLALLSDFFRKCRELDGCHIIFNTMSPLCDYRDPTLFYPSLNSIFELIEHHWGYGIKQFRLDNSYLRYEMFCSLIIETDQT